MAPSKLPKSQPSPVLSSGLLLATVLLTAIGLLTSRLGWPLYGEMLSHFQMQYWVLSLICVGAIALLRGGKKRLMVGVICVAALAVQIVPWYWPPRFVAPHSQGNFRILVANVGSDNQRYVPLIDYVQQQNPDLALFVEVDQAWIKALNEGLRELPYPFEEGRRMVLYSRYPLSEMALRQFSEGSIPSLVGAVTVDQQKIALVATHPPPPIKPTYFESRNQQLQAVGQYVQTLSSPKLVLGDLNITMWSPYYRRLIGETGLKNAREGFGILPSWPTTASDRPLLAWISWLVSIPIDHCLVSPDLPVAGIAVGPNVESDHRPVVVDLQLGNTRQNNLS